jgi:hypothetical protein
MHARAKAKIAIAIVERLFRLDVHDQCPTYAEPRAVVAATMH